MFRGYLDYREFRLRSLGEEVQRGVWVELIGFDVQDKNGF